MYSGFEIKFFKNIYDKNKKGYLGTKRIQSSSTVRFYLYNIIQTRWDLHYFPPHYYYANDENHYG